LLKAKGNTRIWLQEQTVTSTLYWRTWLKSPLVSRHLISYCWPLGCVCCKGRQWV